MRHSALNSLNTSRSADETLSAREIPVSVRFKLPAPDHRRERSSGDDPRQKVGDSGKRVSPSATTRNGSQSGTQPVRREEHSDGAPASQNRSGRSATQAQQKAIHAIAKSKGLDRKMLTGRLRDVYSVGRVEELSIAAASALIDALKNAS